ncbi:MAG: c-type heme family protein, partial [Planctomycetota bacterium]
MFAFLSSVSLSKKIITLVACCTTLVAVTVLLLAIADYRKSAEAALVEQALAFTAVADSTKNHVSHLVSQGTFDNEELVAELKKDLDSGKRYEDSRIFGTIPVVAGWTAAAEAAAMENITFKVASFDARNPDNEPSADPKAGAFRTQML